MPSRASASALTLPSAFFLVPLIIAAVFAPSTSSAADQYNPRADEKAIVQPDKNTRITVLTPRLVRIEWSPDSKFEDRATLAFINRRLPVPRFTVTREGAASVISTEQLRIRYTPASGRPTEQKLSIDLTVAGKPVTWHPGLKDTGNLGGTARTLDKTNGSFPLPNGLISRSGCAVVDDSLKPALQDTPPRWAEARLGAPARRGAPRDTQPMDIYFFGYGHDYKAALRDYAKLGGPVPMPPLYSLGGWWSRYWPYSESDFHQLLSEFRKHGIPLDVLVADIDWHLPNWTGYTWNPQYFPNPDRFTQWVHDEGMHLILNLHPHLGVGPHETPYKDFASAVGQPADAATTIPFAPTDSKFMRAYFDILHRPLERRGVDFWWMDWQQGTTSAIAGLDPLPWLNELHWRDMEENPDRHGARPLELSRWGGLGGHRYPFQFSGDTRSNWPSLEFQPYFTATAGNVLAGWWSHDIGGHIPGPVEPEMYVRWVQFGALSPALRTHTTRSPLAERRIWAYPEDSFRAMRAAWLLRYQLLPYIYTAARECYDSALPLMRPLYYDWPELDEAYAAKTEYMFGPDLLVSPVVQRGSVFTSAAITRTWLPPGEWVNWNSNEIRRGPVTVEQMVPLDEIPIWVRAGAVIPLAPLVRGDLTTADAFISPGNVPAQRTIRNIGDITTSTLILDAFPATTGTSFLYADDGVTTAYTRGTLTRDMADMGVKNSDGVFARTEISWQKADAGDGITLSINPSGSFPFFPKRFILRLRNSERQTSYAVVGLGPGGGFRQEVIAPAPAEPGSDPILDFVPPLFATQIHVPDGKHSLPPESSMETGERRAPEIAAALRRWVSACTTACSDFSSKVDLSTSAPLTDAAAEALFIQASRNCAHIAATPACVREGLRLLGIQPEFHLAMADERTLKVDVTAQCLYLPDPMTARVDVSVPDDWTLAPANTPAPAVATQFSNDNPLRYTSLYTVPENSTGGTVAIKLSIGSDGTSITLPFPVTVLDSIPRYWVIGPFDNPGGISLDTPFPPENGIDLASEYAGKDGRRLKWQKVSLRSKAGDDPADELEIDFAKQFGAHFDNAAAYAFCYLDSDEEREALIAAGADDGLKIWVNGEVVWQYAKGRPVLARSDKALIHLKKGRNTVLFKISQGDGGWGFGACVDKPDGTPISGVHPGL